MDYGIVPVVPAVIVILIALTTRRTFEALLAGTFSAYLIMEGTGFVTAWVNTLYEVLADRDVQWVIIVCGLFGSLIAILSATKSTISFTEKIAKICKSARSALLATEIMGILIFIDDYLNIITLGTCMRPLTDRYKEPPEATAYIIDSTGAPVCVLLPISTWAIFYASIFFSQPEVAALGYQDATSMYIQLIPYAFYPLFTLIVVFLFCMKLLPRLGRMKTAYERVEMEDNVKRSKYTENPVKGEEGDISAKRGNVWDFVTPILLVIILTVVTGEMTIALIVAIFVCLVMYLPRKLITFHTFFDVFMEGFCGIIPTLAVVVAAFMMQHAAEDIGLASFLISVVEPFVNAAVFPAIVFIVVSFLTFITGSNWGIPAVCVPILMPLAAALDANMILTMAAILSAGTFGSHACFYSDATVLTSVSCGIDNMDHALSQFPYAMIGAVLSFAAFLVCGIIGI